MQKDSFSGFKPDDDPKIKGDALRTLFVGRLSYGVRESDLEREFGRFGSIERIRIVKDESPIKEEGGEEKKVAQPKKTKKAHMGYAFVIYERERDMKGNIIPLF